MDRGRHRARPGVRADGLRVDQRRAPGQPGLLPRGRHQPAAERAGAGRVPLAARRAWRRPTCAWSPTSTRSPTDSGWDGWHATGSRSRPASSCRRSRGRASTPSGPSVSPSISPAASDSPGRIDRLLGSCLALYLGRETPGRGSAADEIPLAAQLLALVWFRHNLVAAGSGDAFPGVETTDAADRTRAAPGAGRPLRLTRRRRGVPRRARRSGRVGRPGARASCSASRGGGDQPRARAGAHPRGVRGDRGRDGSEVLKALEGKETSTRSWSITPRWETVWSTCARRIGVDGSALAFVLTDRSDPSLVLNLLDLGVRDVFAPAPRGGPDRRPGRAGPAGARGVTRAAPPRRQGQFSAKLAASPSSTFPRCSPTG